MSIANSRHGLSRRTILLIALIVTASIVFPFVAVKPHGTPSQGKKTPTPQATRKKPQPDLPGTISGAFDPASISDTVALELFMRAISDYPSPAQFKDFNLDDEQIANVLGFVQSFEQTLSQMDQAARMLRSLERNPDALAKLEKKKQDFLGHILKQDLPRLLGADGQNKL